MQDDVAAADKTHTSATTPSPSWGEEELEKKLSERGAFSLSDTELLALVLQCATDGKDRLELAKRLLMHTGNSLSQLSKVSIGQLSAAAGMDRTQAYAVLSALELSRRLQAEEEPDRHVFVSGTADVKRLMRPYLRSLPHEEVWILLLNQSKRLLGRRQISIGGLQGSIADVKIIFRAALGEPTCTAIILVHNHPSGQARPSAADKMFTKKLATAGRSLDLAVLDHVIYTDEHCYSFADEGELERHSDTKESL